MFIPKYKAETLMMPDRVSAKGDAARRCNSFDKSVYVKMKDSSKSSFRDEESERYKKLLKKKEKEETIKSRQFEEHNRVRRI